MKHDHRIDALRDNGFFGVLPTPELRRVARHCEMVELPAGTELTRQHEHGTECFVLDSGSVDVYVDGQVIATAGPGEVVGEIGLLDHGPRTGTARARTPVRAFAIGSREFGAMLENHPVLARRIAAVLGGRVRRADAALRPVRA